MTPDKPTAAELAVELDDIPDSGCVAIWPRAAVAAKRALYAEHAARELFAALEGAGVEVWQL